MILQDKNTLIKLLHQRSLECKHEVLDDDETCRLDCDIYPRCGLLQLLFEVREEVKEKT
jgi:hypothetical protein